MSLWPTAPQRWPPLLAAALAIAWLLVQATDAGRAAVLVAGAALGMTAATAPVLGRTRILAISLSTVATLIGVAVVVAARPTGPAAAAWMIGAPLAAAPVASIAYALTQRRRDRERRP